MNGFTNEWLEGVLEALNNEQVQRKIREIVTEPAAKSRTFLRKDDEKGGKEKKLKSEKERLENENDELKNDNDELKKEVKKLREENRRLLKENEKQAEEKREIEKSRNDYKKWYEDAGQKYQSAKNTIKEKEDALNILDKQYQSAENEIQEQKERIKSLDKNCRYYQENYQRLDSVYQKYRGLNDEIIGDLDRVLNKEGRKSESAEVFFAWGVQEDDITALWDVIAYNMEKYTSSGKIEDLQDIFDYFFEVYQKISGKNMVRLKPQVGEEFDETVHSRDSRSGISGEISKVLLPGYKIGNTGMKKSIVRI